MRILVSGYCLSSLLVLGLIVANEGALTQDSQPPQQNSKYAGIEVCESCHDDLYKSFVKSAHAETLKSKDPAKRGCESCHGPGVEHANAGDPELIQRYRGVKPELILAHCGNCHESEISQAHIKAHLSCLTCHSVHHATQPLRLLIKPAQESCRRCHSSK